MCNDKQNYSLGFRQGKGKLPPDWNVPHGDCVCGMVTYICHTSTEYSYTLIYKYHLNIVKF